MHLMWSIEHVFAQIINFETVCWKLIFLVQNCPNANLNTGDNWSGLSTWIKLLASFSPGEHLCAILSKLSFSPLLPLTALHQGLNAAYTSWVPTSSSSPSKYQVAFWPKKEDYLKCLSSFLQRICFDKCTGNLLFLVDETGLPDLELDDRGMLLMNPLFPPYTPEETTMRARQCEN